MEHKRKSLEHNEKQEMKLIQSILEQKPIKNNPFSTLDEKAKEQALQLLEEISEELTDS